MKTRDLLVLYLSAVFIAISVLGLIFQSDILNAIISFFGLFIIVMTLLLFWQYQWKSRLMRLLFHHNLSRAIWMHLCILLTSSALIALIEPATSEHFDTMLSAFVSLLLPMLVIYGWEAGTPDGTLAIAILSVATVGFLINGILNFGGYILPKVHQIIQKGRKMKLKDHIIIWGNNSHIGEMIEQMISPALGGRRKRIVIFVNPRFRNDAKNNKRSIYRRMGKIEVIVGTALFHLPQKSTS